MSIKIPKKIGFGEGGSRLPKLEGILNKFASEADRIEAKFDTIPQALVSAVAGDIKFVIAPATVDADIADQNVGEFQVMDATVEGLVTAAGAGNIDVTIAAEGMTGSPKTVSVAVANDDDEDAIALAIKTALDLDANIGHGTTGFFAITRADNVLTFTANAEAAQDNTMEIDIATDTAVFEEATPLAVSYEYTEDGVAPYTREVLVRLEDTEGNLHSWFSGTVPVTIAEDTAGDGAAEVVGGLSPEMANGVMTVQVLLRGDWAATDTNTLSVTQKTIIGATVTAVTSEETSIDPA